MSYLFKYPAILITVSILTGIFLASLTEIPIVSFLLFTIILVLFFLHKLNKYSLFRNKIIFFIVPLLFGIIRFEIAERTSAKWEFTENYIKNASVHGKIIDLNLIKDDQIKLKIKTDSIDVAKKITYYKSINLLVNIKLDTSINRIKAYKLFKVNDQIKFKGKIVNPPGRRVFGDFNYQNFLKSENILGVAYTKYDSSFVIKKTAESDIRDFFVEFRENLDITLSKIYNRESYSLLRGLILGDRGVIDPNIKQDYSRSGVAHVLAVSGLHIGLIIYLIFLMLGRLSIKVKYILAIIYIILFSNLTGNSPSVVRATIMGVLFILCKYFNRDYAGINSLFLSLLLILIVNPFQIYSIGLQLSFISVFTIILVSRNIERYLEAIKINYKVKKIIVLISITLSCQITTLPILLYNFHQISIIAIISNLFIIPLISLILILGLISLMISIINLKIGIILGFGVQKLVSFNNFLVNYFAEIKYSYVEFYNFTEIDILLFYIVIVIILAVFFSKNIKYKLIIACILLCLFYPYYLVKNNNSNKLEVMILDVGQGDAFLIKTPNNKAILLDAGNKNEYYDAGLSAIIPSMNYLSIKKLDYVFITHIDADHYLGLYSLLNKYKITKLYKPKVDYKEKKDIHFETILGENKIAINNFKNEIITIDGVRFYILNENEFVSTNNNDRSGLIKIVYGKHSFLLMGDATKKIEKYLLAKYGNFLKSDVLKAGHHGSNSSSDSSFLAVVNPKFSIISCGVFNPYGLPSEKAIERLKKRSKILRTDQLGTLIFETDGINLSVKDLNNNLKD